MPIAQLPPGLMLDKPVIGPAPYWRWGVNVRSRMGLMETLGLYAPLRAAAGAQIALPGGARYRTLKAVPSPSQGQIIAASVTHVMALQYDTASIPGTGTRWLAHAITPAALPALADVVSDPGVGRVEIPPAWWLVEQEDIVVGGRADDITGGVYVWGRNVASPMTEITTAPKGAVAAAIIGRILVLLGARSLTDPDPARHMTIRWSDRFNFAAWTPSDLNVSGEMQLEGGSRIMGGGATAKGVLAWTDTRMAALTETGDPDSVFARRYIDGARGLMSNRAWCEADGQVWWYDETRTLNVWDGGAPVQVPCPIRKGTLELVSDKAIARATLTPNIEFSEIILWLGIDDPDVPDTAIVFNYADKAWTVWRLPRTAWSTRVGAIRTLGVDAAGLVYQHDLDAGLTAPWRPPGINPPAAYDPLTDAVPYSWTLETALLTTDNPQDQSQYVTRYLLDHLPSPAPGHLTDSYTLELTGYGAASMDSPTYTEARVVNMGQPQADFRVGGKAVRARVYGTGATVWTFGASADVRGAGGER